MWFVQEMEDYDEKRRQKKKKQKKPAEIDCRKMKPQKKLTAKPKKKYWKPKKDLNVMRRITE